MAHLNVLVIYFSSGISWCAVNLDCLEVANIPEMIRQLDNLTLKIEVESETETDGPTRTKVSLDWVF